MDALRSSWQSNLVAFLAFAAFGAPAHASPEPANSLQSLTASHAPRVLQVGTYRGRKGAYSTIQAAVDAAAPGDWILMIALV